MVRLVKGKKEKSVKEIIDKAAILNVQAKEIEKELKPLKEQLKKHIKENYTQDQIKEGILIDGNDYILKVEGCEEREEANPEEVLNYLTEQNKGDRFFDVIKVHVASLTDLIGNEAVKAMRKFLCYTPRQKFIKRKNNETN